MNNVLIPEWPAPSNIHAFTTLRSLGCLTTETARKSLIEQFSLPSEPIWLKQIHSAIPLPALTENKGKEADATYTQEKNRVCVVLTGDCIPLLICHQNGTHVAAIHAGWRGLVNGVIESTLSALQVPTNQLLAWLGPAISADHYEVGNEVRELFVKQDKEAVDAFIPSPHTSGHWLADLYGLARLRLKKQGIHTVFGGEYCTFSDEKRFFSSRRGNKTLGRMASLIWIGDSS